MTRPVMLIADDEIEARRAILDFLEARFDCEFKEARDGEEAILFIKSNPCDVVLLDIKMPKKSGITVIKEAKEYNPKIDILVVSAYVSDDVAEQAFKYGATDYAVKPMNLKVIGSKVRDILKRRNQLISKT